MKNKLILITVCLVAVQLIWAQNNPDDLGVQEVQITDYFIPEIPPSSKIERLPTLKDTIQTSHQITIQPINKEFESKLALIPIKAAKIKGQPLPKIDRILISGGVGNMSMPTSKIYYNSDRDKNTIYGIGLAYVESYANIKSSFDEMQKVSAAFRKTDVSLFAKTDLDIGILSGRLLREGRLYQAYGYDPTMFNLAEELTQQYWGYSSFNIVLEGKTANTNMPRYTTKLTLYDLNEYTENLISWSLDLNKQYAENEYFLKVGLDYFLNNLSSKYQFVDSLKKELIFTLKPTITKQVHGGTLALGFDLKSVGQRDSSAATMSIFPAIRYSYVVSEDYVSARAGVRGGLQKNSYWSLSKINPFVLNAQRYDGGTLELVNTKTIYDIYAGFSTYMGNNISIDAECSYANVKQMPFFELDANSTFSNKFKVVYDDVMHFHATASLHWKSSKKSQFDLSFDLHDYQTDSLKHFAYKPTLITRLKGHYNLGDKIIPQIELFTAFNRSFHADTSNGLDLDDIIDFNISLEYKYNTNISAYFKGYNLIGGYQTWQHYPVLGPQVFFGLSFKL